MTEATPDVNELLEEISNLRRQVAELEQSKGLLRVEDDLLFETIFKATPDAISISRLRDGLYVDVNRGFEAISGYSRSELIGRSSLDIELWPSLADREKMIAELEQNGVIANMEAIFRVKDDRLMTGLTSARVISLHNEPHMLAVTKDITEWKDTSRALLQQNQKLELLNRIISASAGISEPETILDIACRELGEALQVSQVTALMFSPDKRTAIVSAEYRHGDFPSLLKQVMPLADDPTGQYLLQTQAPLVINEMRPADTRLAPMYSWMTRRNVASMLLIPLIVDDEPVGSLSLESFSTRHFTSEEVSLAWSVSDQVSSAVALSWMNAELQLLSTAVDQAADIILVADNQGTIRYINPAYERTTGQQRSKVLGRSLLLLHHEPDGEVVESLWRTVTAGQVWRGQMTNYKPDGSAYTVDTTITPITDETGQITNFVGTQRDVTRERQLEMQYLQAQKMDAVGQLTAGIAHDFNNLIMAINGFAELMQFKLPADSPFQEMAGRIVNSGESAANLIRQLLIFSRKQVADPKVVDLNQVVTDIDKMLRRVIGEHIELQLALDAELWPIKIDSTQIEQVVVNMSVNSRDAMPNGGKLTIATENIHLSSQDDPELLGVVSGDYVLLTIRDTGAGMSQEIQNQIFEPFFTTKEAGKGSGLGLATVYGIVKQAGGAINVDSAVNQGSIFRLYLPKATEFEASTGDRLGDSQMPAGTETVLLVEDSPAVRELVQLTLQTHGYQVLTASDGMEALRLFGTYPGPVDLLLTDVVMPNMNGKELADKMRVYAPQIRIIFTSGYTNDAIAHYGVLGTGVNFLQKPFSPAALITKVREVLDAPE
jgi:PAS domain S-box-containing protein